MTSNNANISTTQFPGSRRLPARIDLRDELIELLERDHTTPASAQTCYALADKLGFRGDHSAAVVISQLLSEMYRDGGRINRLKGYDEGAHRTVWAYYWGQVKRAAARKGRRESVAMREEMAALRKEVAELRAERAQQAPDGPRHHELKTDPDQFAASWAGQKPWEIRLNDRGYAVGDKLTLRETVCSGEEMRNGEYLVYSGRSIRATIAHLLQGPVYGLAEGWAVMTLDNMENVE